jgi:predicted 2-oxoglutarate/Fe(II)-dependent dioxygenase YbiX
VPEDALRTMADRVCALAPEVASFFAETLTEYETPHFVIYEPDDFYRPHRDLYRDVDVPEPLGRRRIAIVVFLNDRDRQSAIDESPDEAAPPSGRFRGGALRLCSHELDDFEPELAWEVPAERGLLVAFRADTWHEVTPVTHGRRYTVVALLLAPSEPGAAAKP